MSLKQTFRTFVRGTEFKVSYKDPTSRLKMVRDLDHKLHDVDHKRPIVVVCIGTDRSTGDSLGPLVGTRLTKFNDQSYSVYGHLDSPVHAVNLKETIDEIDYHFKNPFIIAVDASLGRYHNIGILTVADGPVLPGAGVRKDLPPVGDIHITGIVNVSGYMEYVVLQNTRLSIVMSMSEIIGDCLHRSISRHISKNSHAKITFN